LREKWEEKKTNNKRLQEMDVMESNRRMWKEPKEVFKESGRRESLVRTAFWRPKKGLKGEPEKKKGGLKKETRGATEKGEISERELRNIPINLSRHWRYG